MMMMIQWAFFVMIQLAYLPAEDVMTYCAEIIFLFILWLSQLNINFHLFFVALICIPNNLYDIELSEK